jgi:membrane associated rhomboid family serine protease
MLLPYRAKNPPERFPYATLGLIGINILVFALTSELFMEVRKEAIDSFALTHATLLSEPWRILTSMFLHADIFHIGGNMLFLWLFGASVEGRLGPFKFLTLYLTAGVVGDLLSDLMWGTLNPDAPSLGASGAIMGLGGAYLYMFPYSLICIFYWLGWFWRGVFEMQARWVVLFYIGIDMAEALLFQGRDGVGHFAHLGGFGAGLLIAFLFRAQRDSEAVSQVQAIRADVKDYSLLSLGELEALLQQPTDNMELVLAYSEKAGTRYGGVPNAQYLAVLNYYAPRLMVQANPERLAYILLNIPPQSGGLPLVFYLRLASRLEALTSNDLAAQIYRRVYDLSPYAPETETALFRLAQLMERAFMNRPQAHAIYQEMLRLFPNGTMAVQARHALQQR